MRQLEPPSSTFHSQESFMCNVLYFRQKTIHMNDPQLKQINFLIRLKILKKWFR
jgi:hypothetical protein